jgi:HSP20 family protein
VPRTNILEGEKDYRLEMDLPGVRNEDLEISVEDDTLTVKAERSLEVPEGYHSRRTEMNGKIAWRRSFELGNGVDLDDISARLEHGILTVTLPKSEKSLPRRIEVK